ncbi:hypothetical protein G3U99_13430 [Vibrio coralliilyticus OCN008]|uniref:hypothetical protein n=1 Tax=Vibrio coralliilyticus TaxID=190893 RepID=UPI0013F4A4A9|nr:hypothetical protein [Vibrio coralliilyticus]QIJ84742.1 hypothetical protein G3U99_10985 [Vibrio coralliilyticus OCN008]QIJ85200.1 hypothetical protein G3U99_13430 [Vibrio coralliilyticus OCN008]
MRRYRQPVGGHSDGILVPQTDYDRTQTVYDRHGRVRFHMDEKWVLTEYRYLEGGRDKRSMCTPDGLIRHNHCPLLWPRSNAAMCIIKCQITDVC